MDEKEGLPVTNLKEYIISLRKSQTPESKIVEALRKVNWPEDIINSAESEASQVIAPVPDAPAVVAVAQVAPQETAPAVQKDLFTQPPEGIFKTAAPEAKKEAPEVRKFSWFCLLSLLFAPVPFVGLWIGSWSLDNAGKHKMTGGFFSLLTIAINVAVILFLFYVLYQIFTMNSDQLTGLSKIIVERFNLL